MTEKNLFEEMLNDYLPEEKKAGDIIDGIISRKEMEFSYLDLGLKEEGRILTREIEDLNVGDLVEVKVLRKEEEYVIVSKFLLDKAKEFATYEVEEIVTGEIIKKIKGGYSVKVGKNEAFLPFSLAGLDKETDYAGHKFKLVIKEKNKNNLMVSRIDLVKKEEEEFYNKINLGDIIKGKVKQVLDFGVILDFGVTTGFIHISEISWNKVEELVDKFNIGDEVEAKVIEKDIEAGKIKLSIKQLTENPWNKVQEKYKVGEILEKSIKEVLDFGLVFELEKGIEGFLHISDLSYRKIANLNNKFKIGEIVKFKIIGFNDEKERVNLSAKALLDDKWAVIDEKINLGDIISGTVTNIQDYGIFVEVQDEIEAFIHRNEFAWDKNELQEYKVGDKVEFKVINLEKDERKLGGSIKQLTISPWKEAANEYKVGNKVNVPIVVIEENFVLVKLTERFNGVIPKKELTVEFLKNINDEFKIGDVVEAVVIETNEKRKSIVLSAKKIKELEEKQELDELMKKYGV